MQDLQGAFMTLFVIVATSSMGLIGTYATLWMAKLKAKAKVETNQIEDETQRKIVNDVLDKTASIITDTVASASETIVKGIKASAEDGKLSIEDGQKVFDAVKTDVLAQIPSKSQAILAETVGDINVYLEKKIEIAVKDVKIQNILQ